jgi:hypothetical protein
MHESESGNGLNGKNASIFHEEKQRELSTHQNYEGLYSMIIFYDYILQLLEKPGIQDHSPAAANIMRCVWVPKSVLCKPNSFAYGASRQGQKPANVLRGMNIYQFETLVNTSMASYLGKSFYINLYNSHLE